MRKCENFEKTIENIKKQHGENSIMKASEMPNIDVVSTGVAGIDAALGVNGIKKGSIVEIYGAESVGKTILALQMVKQYQKTGMQALYIDSDRALTRENIKATGIEEDKFYLLNIDNLEESLDTCIFAASSFGIIVIDSIAGLPTKAQRDCNVGDSNAGASAKLISKALPILIPILSRNGCTLIIISQIRERLGIIFGNPTISMGGRALKHYATQRIELTRIETLKNKSGACGFRIRARVVKNKISAPLKETEFDILFESGIEEG